MSLLVKIQCRYAVQIAKSATRTTMSVKASSLAFPVGGPMATSVPTKTAQWWQLDSLRLNQSHKSKMQENPVRSGQIGRVWEELHGYSSTWKLFLGPSSWNQNVILHVAEKIEWHLYHGRAGHVELPQHCEWDSYNFWLYQQQSSMITPRWLAQFRIDKAKFDKRCDPLLCRDWRFLNRYCCLWFHCHNMYLINQSCKYTFGIIFILY